MEKDLQQKVDLLGPQTLLDERAAAKLLGVSPRVLWGLADAGSIPFIRIGPRLKRYDPADLERFINDNRRHAPRGQRRGDHGGMQHPDHHASK
jgi:hypothetical protein